MAACVDVVLKLEKEFGLSKQKAEETAKNKTVVENALSVLREVCASLRHVAVMTPILKFKVMSAFLLF